MSGQSPTTVYIKYSEMKLIAGVKVNMSEHIAGERMTLKGFH